ncbi:MAG: hypothetical protein HYR83_02280 [Planctomycetes bacterium]|nr:hypothetical protein [Planctomycetota bacterium]
MLRRNQKHALVDGVLMVCLCLAADRLSAQTVPLTLEDFHLPGTQVGDVAATVIKTSDNCAACHGDFDPPNEPYNTWRGSLMGQAGRDPLFYAQMTTANQDTGTAGYFCMRCHVPMSFVTEHAYNVNGSTLDSRDRDGVNCHLCHSMVDPVYRTGVSPPQDEAILNALSEVPAYYGNSMFVLDPTGLRRGPYADAQTPHAFAQSDFQLRGDLCGTCHDVGNVAVTRQLDGTYRYNNINEATPTENLANQFPLERTYTEWKLSAFASGGVDMGGRFGGDGAGVVSTCQDCHMPRTTAQGCFFGPVRSDLAKHDFAGASAWVLKIIGLYYANDTEVDQASLAEGQARAVSMVKRAASLELEQMCGSVRARVINESGHKLPTGHIEGRRVWVNVQCFDAQNTLLREYGHYDPTTAELDEASTTVYEMHVGLSEYASSVTGFAAGVTTHMALADVIEKDTRIPPRGFDNSLYADAGAPAVGIQYADGQFWDDTEFWVPDGTTRVDVTLYYQTATKHYIEALHSANHTDHWGETLYQLWLDTGKGAPIKITSNEIVLVPFMRGDADYNTEVDLLDFEQLTQCMRGPSAATPHGCNCMDFMGNGSVDLSDFAGFQSVFAMR